MADDTTGQPQASATLGRVGTLEDVLAAIPDGYLIHDGANIETPARFLASFEEGWELSAAELVRGEIIHHDPMGGVRVIGTLVDGLDYHTRMAEAEEDAREWLAS